jgi:hypothetical protein
MTDHELCPYGIMTDHDHEFTNLIISTSMGAQIVVFLQQQHVFFYKSSIESLNKVLKIRPTQCVRGA